MIDLFNTDYMDYMESCAAILIIRVDKKKVHLCESLNLCESVNSALPLATIGTQESVALSFT